MLFDENSKPTKSANVVGKAKAKTIEETYTKKTQLEHILLRPDTYIGSVEKHAQQMWVFSRESKQVEYKNINYVPGLFKIFDEIIVNAADNKQRDPTMNRIDVNINEDDNMIRVGNNGKGVPIVIHKEHNIYIPELIFGNLLTGSNFNDDEEKTTGGRNGYGAKLTNIFSKRFIIETVDSTQGLKYRQEFRNNMSVRDEPVITKHAAKEDYTSVTFYPDLARFKMDCLDEDIVSLLCKRVYDIAGTTNSSTGAKLNVLLNGERIETKSFQSYIGLYKDLEPPVAFEKIDARWEIGVGASDDGFEAVSFVNSIATTKGGTHVAYIVDQITSKLAAAVKKRNKGEEVKASQIKNHLAVYVNCLITNPAFDSQTKETLTTKASSFGSTCVVPDRMLKLIEKSPIIDHILNSAKTKQIKDLQKKSGSKRSNIIGITKLDDANCAGTSKSSECTLILTEGDSAKALAISGLGVVGRDYYGVFPLKGKLLNVREATHAQIMKNEEISNIMKIMGLTVGKVYDNTSSLRYGHLMIMADQDTDGSHIKGLIINFLHHYWPSLLKIKGFLQQFITPIVKCVRGKKEQTFFTIPQYQNWRADNDEGRGWKIKYYKGLGTSTAAEAKEYFSNLGTHEVDFHWADETDDLIELAFSKKRADDRKTWILSMEPGVYIDYTKGTVGYDDFVNRELVLFSHSDLERSIPHCMDGLKTSQRKVLFSCFKRNLKQEIKVAQLAGYVSEQSAYHHGEASLTQTIIGMAQNHVGSNNINLLSPCGQFGTRLMGGKDAASPRYVFTKLQNITRCIFHPDDDKLLDYLDDDGQSIEPAYYVPVIPMALVNGSAGIGTGWSTDIPTYNPREIIAMIRSMLEGQQAVTLQPWFRGFTGAVQAKSGRDCNNFTVSGILEQTDESTVVISELPVGKWTTDYKVFLESVLIGAAAPSAKDKEDGTSASCTPFVKDFKENHTDTTVLFTVNCDAQKLAEFVNEKGGLVKKFKMDSSVATSNMHMFDLGNQIKKYEGPADVMRDFFDIRMMFYDKRKAHLAAKLTEEWEKLDNKARFVKEVCNDQVVISKRKDEDIVRDLRKRGYKTFVEKKAPRTAAEPGTPTDEESVNGDEDEEPIGVESGYDYLLDMKIRTLTLEKALALEGQRDTKRRELDALLSKTAEDLWLKDLDALEVALGDFEDDIETEKRREQAARRKAKNDKANKGKGGKASGKASRKGRNLDSDEDEQDYDSEFEEEKAKKAAAKKRAAAAAVAKAAVAKAQAAPVVAPVAVTKPITEHFKPVAASITSNSSQTVFSKPVVTAKSKITMSAKPMEVVELDMETMSLAERLALARVGSESSKVSAPVLSKPVSVPKVAISSKPKAKPVPKATIVCSDDDSSDIFVEVAPVVSRQPRAVATVKKSYAIDSDDSCDDDEDLEDSFVSDEDDQDDSASGSDDDFSGSRKKKNVSVKKAVSAPVVSKPVVASKAAASKPVTKPVVPAIKTTPVKKATGVKRAAKGSESVLIDLYSPGAVSPKAAKKTKTVKPAVEKAKPAAKPAAAAVAKKAPAAKKIKKTARSDDEDEEFDSQDDVSPVSRLVSRSPKPVRARKPTTYAYAEDSEEEEDDFIVDDSDEESEFDE